MMKRSAIVVALALGLMAQGAMAKTLNVVSSFSVLGDIAQQVGGEHVHVDTLVGPDGDPHTFEPSPKDSALLSKADVVVVSDLIYSKVSNKPARWVLAVADDSPYQKPEDLAGKRIATELMGVCTEYFKERNIPVNINYSWGATEAKVVEGLADAIVEVTETETTIRAHDLRVIDEVLVTNTVLIANAAAMQDPEKRRKIEQIDLLLQGALRAESLVCLKMNAPAAKLEAVLALLPSLNSPTVAPLQNGEWLSLETVVSTGIVRDLIPQLREAGAEGILEYALNKVI
mgnify:CR=1 FL=1